MIRLTIDDLRTLQAESTMLEYISPELAAAACVRKHLQLQLDPAERHLADLPGHADHRGGPRPAHQRGGLPPGAPRGHPRVRRREAAFRRSRSRRGLGYAERLRPDVVIGRVRKKQQDSNYQGQDDGRFFIPDQTARKDFPLPGVEAMNTQDHLSTIIAAPYPHVTEQMRRLIDRETNMISFVGLNARWYWSKPTCGAFSKRHGFG